MLFVLLEAPGNQMRVDTKGSEMKDDMNCPFCDLLESASTLAGNEYAAAFKDAYPLSDGHMLVVPRTHEPDFLELDKVVQRAIFDLAVELADGLRSDPEVTGINIGVNAGTSAGQTIEHAHLHVIPRRDGDIEDPRGGVRWVLPSKADYWSD